MALSSHALCSSHAPSPLSSRAGTRRCLSSPTSPPEETGWDAQSCRSLHTSLPRPPVLLCDRAPRGISSVDTLSEPSGKEREKKLKTCSIRITNNNNKTFNCDSWLFYAQINLLTSTLSWQINQNFNYMSIYTCIQEYDKKLKNVNKNLLKQ